MSEDHRASRDHEQTDGGPRAERFTPGPWTASDNQNPRPIRGPYPVDTVLAARSFLKSQGHTRRTIQGAEGTNSPLWQKAIWPHLSMSARTTAVQS